LALLGTGLGQRDAGGSRSLCILDNVSVGTELAAAHLGHSFRI